MALCMRTYVAAVCALLGMMIPYGETTSNTLPPWKMDKECHIPSDPYQHPVTTYTRNIINLEKMYKISSPFWVLFSGSLAIEGCELKAGVLYLVERNGKNIYSYTNYKNGKGTKAKCPGHQLWLGAESYGFVSCAEDENKASAAAWEWWSEVPLSYISIVLIGVACALVLITLISIGIYLIRRRKTKGTASLPQMDLY